MEVNKGYSWKKFWRDVFNVFWILTVGLSSAISHAVTGILQCITIIGIPFGKAHFAFIKLVFAPAGKVVVTKYSRHPFLNTLWLIFGGFAVCLQYVLTSLLLYVSIIGIPLAKQLSKLSAYVFAPFGAEILKDGEYSREKNLTYDIKLLNRHICANPNAPVMDRADGRAQTAREYIRSLRKENAELIIKKPNDTFWIVWTCFWLSLLIANFIVALSGGIVDRVPQYVAPGFSALGFLMICSLKKKTQKKGIAFSKKHLLCLIEYYPNSAPLAKEKCAWYDKVQKTVGLPTKKREMKTYLKRICANPQVPLRTSNGNQITVAQYIYSKKATVDKMNKSTKRAIFATIIGMPLSLAVWYVVESLIINSSMLFTLIPEICRPPIFICLIMMFFVIIILFLFGKNSIRANRKAKTNFLISEVVYPLLDYYPQDTPESKKYRGTYKELLKVVGLSK